MPEQAADLASQIAARLELLAAQAQDEQRQAAAVLRADTENIEKHLSALAARCRPRATRVVRTTRPSTRPVTRARKSARRTRTNRTRTRGPSRRSDDGEPSSDSRVAREHAALDAAWLQAVALDERSAS
jgi:hypothetical protein